MSGVVSALQARPLDVPAPVVASVAPVEAVLAAGARAEQADLQAVLTLLGDQYVLGQPIAFTLTLKNVGPRALRLHMGARELHRFELEMGLAGQSFQPVDYGVGEPVGGGPPLRDYGPGDMVGASGILLFRAPQIARLTPDGFEKALLSRRLVCDLPGVYVMRAKIGVDFGEEQKQVVSNEVRFRVGPPADGYDQFMDFARRFFLVDFALPQQGYKDAEAVARVLEGTGYHRPLVLAMMASYLKGMEDRPYKALSEAEGKARDAYRKIAESMLVQPEVLRTKYGEIALTYLTLYYAQAQDLEKALAYAERLRTGAPWSPQSQLATAIRRTMEKQKRKQGSP
jgi:hypothetical protein